MKERHTRSMEDMEKVRFGWPFKYPNKFIIMDYPHIFILQFLVENSQFLLIMYHLIVCNIFLLLNAPIFMTLYIIMSTRRAKVRKE